MPSDFRMMYPASRTNDPNAMPDELKDQLDELEEWARGNMSDSRRDATAFWGLKVPAIFAAASAGVWAHFDWTTASVISGSIASVCVIIDGVHPRGMLRNTHLRACHDIRILMGDMVTRWRTRASNATPGNTARRIIKEAAGERERIAKYIRDAETALAIKTEA